MNSLRLLRRVVATRPRAAATGQTRSYALVKPPAVPPPPPSQAPPGPASASAGSHKPAVVLEYKPRTEVPVRALGPQAAAAAAAAAGTAAGTAGAGAGAEAAVKKPTTNLPAVIDERLPWSMQPLEARKKIYKKAAGRWTRGMVAMPIFIMSSYWLYDRLIVGTPKKEFPENWRKPPGEVAETEQEQEGEKSEGTTAV